MLFQSHQHSLDAVVAHLRSKTTVATFCRLCLFIGDGYYVPEPGIITDTCLVTLALSSNTKKTP